MHQLLIFGRFVVVALGQRGCNLFDLILDGNHLGKGFGRFVDKRSGVGNLHLLRKIADRTVAISSYGTRGGLLFARDDAQQGGLTCAVLANQTDSILRIDQKRNLVKERPTAETDGEIINRNHLCYALRIFKISASGSAALNTALPATSASQPAS